MKLHNYRFTESIQIALLGDIHCGNVNFDKDLFIRVLKLIGSTDSYYILMGDIADAITPKDKRYDWDTIDRNLMTVDEQYSYVIDRLLYYLDTDKCLGVLAGNHDEKIRTTSMSGSDWTQRLCVHLNAPFLGYMNYIHLGFDVDGKRSKRDLFLYHGSGKGVKPGSKVNKLQDLMVGFLADIYCMGHTHLLGHYPTTQLRVLSNGRHSTIKSYPVDLVHTGGFYRGYTQEAPRDYVAKAGLNPLRLGCPILQFFPADNRVRVHLESE